MLNKFLIYKSSGYNPYRNIAEEKFLTDICPSDTVILYLWQNDNTIVIGQNQNPYIECKPDGGRLFIARRLSGGGAVYHDRGNLNFSFIRKAEDMDISQNMQIIKRACAMAGIETELSGRNDLLYRGRKFSGNAFYNTKGNAYHHGTIMINCDTERMSALLTPPKAKLEAKGVKSVRSRVTNLSERNPGLTPKLMSEYMIKAAEEVFALKAIPMEMPDSEDIKSSAELFASKEYIYGKTPPFTKEAESRFDWGTVRIIMEIKKNVIINAMAYTDSMDWTLGSKIKRALTDCEYDKRQILARLGAELDLTMAKQLADMID